MDFILDFETIGQNETKSVVVDCSYCMFDRERFLLKPYSFEELVSTMQYAKFDIESQVKNYGYQLYKEDLKFWSKLPVHARKPLTPTKEDLSLVDFRKSVIEYLTNKKIDYWWSRGNNFDPVVLARIFRDTGNSFDLNQYLPYWRVRDIRTFIDAKFNFNTINGFVPVADKQYWGITFQEHNSVHDVAADILRMQAILRAEADLDMVEK